MRDAAVNTLAISHQKTATSELEVASRVALCWAVSNLVVTRTSNQLANMSIGAVSSKLLLDEFQVVNL
jgi:hypothetical protein